MAAPKVIQSSSEKDFQVFCKRANGFVGPAVALGSCPTEDPARPRHVEEGCVNDSAAKLPVTCGCLRAIRSNPKAYPRKSKTRFFMRSG